MNNATITNTFSSDNRNITKIKTQNRPIMTTIANRTLKFETMIKIPIVTNYAFFTADTVVV